MNLAAHLFASVVALLGQGQSSVPAPARDAVLVIDGVPVPGDEYGRWMIDLFASRMTKTFAEQWLVRREAEKRGVELAPGAVGAEIDGEVAERIEGAFLGKKADWLDELRRTGWSEGGYRRYRETELEPWMLATEMCRRTRVVPEELVVRDWEHFYGPQGHEYTLSGILIGVAVESPPDGAGREAYDAKRRQTFAAALAKALDVRERAVSGEDFAALAREVSDDAASRAAGGHIDAKFRPPGWNDPFVKSILELGAGALSMPLYAKGGYWIVRVEELVVTPLESVRDELVQRLTELGPEAFEVGATWDGITADMRAELLPSMFQGPTAPETREPVIGMLINGQPVPRAEFAVWLLHGRGEHYARDFAEHWLVEREARERGIEATPEEVEARLQEWLQWMLDQGYKGSRDAWLTYLRQRGRDEAGWRQEWTRRMRIDVLAEKLLKSERVVTDEQVRERWRQIYGSEGKWVEARMILIAVPPPRLEGEVTREELDRAIAAARDEARGIAAGLAQRLADGEDFATLARMYSSDEVSRARGGQLEGRFRPDQWPDELSRVVLGLEPGAITPALDTGKGFAVFEILDAREVPFNEVQGEIRAELENERVPQNDLATYRNVLYKRATVEVAPSMYAER